MPRRSLREEESQREWKRESIEKVARPWRGAGGVEEDGGIS